jgi:hypothetical protein
VSLFDGIIERARTERRRREAGRDLISRDECPVDVSSFGELRWYVHPELELPSTRALYFCELEIPPGSRTGKLFSQGGQVHFVLQGRGHTVVDGNKHEWEAEDVIAIPVREDGIAFQHFSEGDSLVRMVLAWPNLDSALGPEGGVAMDVLEPAPVLESNRDEVSAG